jgi:tetratricopeptide (TPR) repeat protein
MINLALSLVVGLAVFVTIKLTTEFGWAGALFPALVAAMAAYLVLARRTWKRLEALFDGMQKELQAGRFEKSVKTLESGFALAPWQFLVASQLHSNLGMLLYIREQYDEALPHLEQSFSRHWIARGMLAVSRWRRRDLDGMRRIFEDAVKTNKKEGVLWSVYGFLLEKEGLHEDAIRIMGRAVHANPSDDKLKASLQALQNGKKMKLGKLYGEQWFQFRLEPPPGVVAPGFQRGSRRMIFRGR